MTQDEIIRMAGHRTVSPWVMKLVLEAVEAEREKCAKYAEDFMTRYEGAPMGIGEEIRSMK